MRAALLVTVFNYEPSAGGCGGSCTVVASFFHKVQMLAAAHVASGYQARDDDARAEGEMGNMGIANRI